MAEISTPTIKNRADHEQNSTLNSDHGDFSRLMDGLKGAVSRFQDQATPESFAQIISALGEFGLSGAKLWEDATAYTKRHPVRVAFAAGLGFFAIKGLLGHCEEPKDQLH